MAKPHILFIDNFDSFTFNLVDALLRLDIEVDVYRNDIAANDALRFAEKKRSTLIVLSPGPGKPADAGCTIALVRLAAKRFPIFGVCLGHQAIAESFGGIVGAADTIMHGKKSRLTHHGHSLFDGLPRSFDAGRYHSLIVKRLPENFDTIAEHKGEIMAIAHHTLPIFGVQFHPESILTTQGQLLMRNVFRLAQSCNIKN
ncbi:MAG: aminodeoxychorismate/anthranilate synthase component II [Burkholderiales bacterium]|jgi:anthranilate synthase/aminodeoxychorismate synthase-like glutamine amidotransferase|nr:aminodeoxychorismate/anthranilate synthase component II [Burkholderiales bacterium]